MAFSYRWSDLILLVSRQVKNIPTQQLDAFQCDLVSQEMAQRLPWKFQQQTIADGQIPLIDWVQDYDPPFNIWRLTAAWLTCTSTNPNDDVSLTIKDSNAPDQFRRSPYAIRSISLEGGVGKLRLEAAVIIPENQTWELRGIYQINPTKVVSTSQIVWFDDRYVNVAVEGLTYWYYKLADDPRAGSTSTSLQGPPAFSGQLAQFMGAIQKMALSEDQGGDMQTMPDAPLGITAGHYGHIVAAFGFGGGSGTNEQSRGVVAVNNDTSPTQFLIAGSGISITSIGVGAHMISLIGTAPPTAPPPTIVSVSPASGGTAGGTTVTITGTNFAPGATVLFGGVAAINVIVLSDTTISATTPATTTAGAVTLWVTVQGQPASLPDAFVYIASPVPTVTTIAPNVGPANATTAVTITGTNFAGSATVTFGGTAATGVVVQNPTTITATAPARAAGAVNVVVLVGGQAVTVTNGFTYQAVAAPIYGGFGAWGATGPASLSGTQVTLSGTSPLVVLNQLQTAPETTGQSWTFNGLSDQVVYLLLVGASHTFENPQQFAFPFDPPVVISLSGRTLYLYASSNTLYGSVTVVVKT